MKSVKGTTLLELMAVLGVLGVLLATAVPYISGMNQSQLADRLYRELENDLRYARNYSVTNGVSVMLEPRSGWDGGWRILGDNGSGTLNEELRVTNLESKGNISSDDFSKSTPIVFSARGRANKSGEVKIDVAGCRGTRVRTLFINRIGQIILKGENVCK
ncbi:hypothetical protein CHH28_09605 [Bacterioplanes sanyensis]|uniref:Type II secretion system protein H n=1 Tax=Bacterioplanes sanyensis TaxID=1249553 RepID=A0A222FKM5_9GAMM|nr:GspH/FimT family pseudopilin [Bacterioplanes sanyensis]ASP38921.1 hypothetical protein CHH28_09605 [Bacterioplanes sanyensis]